jgi:hypothetical protein
MKIKGIGFTVHGPSVERDLEILKARLDEYQGMEVKYLEKPSQGLDIILNGEF